MTIKELKIRIKGVQSIQKITKAMQMVSASKLRFIMEKLALANKYYEVVSSMVSDSGIANQKKVESTLDSFLLVTADKGLCGSHSSSICKYYLNLNTSVTSNAGLIALGGKSVEILGASKKDLISLFFSNVFKKGFSFFELVDVSNKLSKLFTLNGYENLHVVFNKFVSSVSTDLVEENVDLTALKSISNDDVDSSSLVFFYLTSLLYYTVTNSKASEESTRMQSMDNATSSANDLLDDLTRMYNMSRQVSITTELIEIVSGAESLKQGKN